MRSFTSPSAPPGARRARHPHKPAHTRPRARTHTSTHVQQKKTAWAPCGCCCASTIIVSALDNAIVYYNTLVGDNASEQGGPRAVLPRLAESRATLSLAPAVNHSRDLDHVPQGRPTSMRIVAGTPAAAGTLAPPPPPPRPAAAAASQDLTRGDEAKAQSVGTAPIRARNPIWARGVRR